MLSTQLYEKSGTLSLLITAFLSLLSLLSKIYDKIHTSIQLVTHPIPYFIISTTNLLIPL